MSSRNFIMKIGGVVDPSLSKSFNKSSSELKKLSDEMHKLKSTSRHISKLKQSEAKLEEQFAKGREEYKRQQRELYETSKKVGALQKSLNKTHKPTKAMINEFKRAKKAEDRLKISTEKQRQALVDGMRQMKEARSETKKYSQSQEELARSMKKVEASQKKLKAYEGLKKSVSDNAGGTFTRSAGEAAVLGVAVKFAIDDEEAFADVRKTTGLTGKEAEKFQKELKRATKDIPKFNAEIYEIAAAAGQAGINLKEIPKFAADTAKVSVAFDMEAGDAGDTLATWREAFKMSQKEVMVLADQMNLIGDSIKVKPAQVAEMTTTVGSLGRLANFTEAQTAALGGTLVALGIKDSSTASTAIRKLYGTLASGEAATSSVSSAFQKMGLDAIQVAQDLQKDSEGTLMKVFERLNKLDKAEQLSVTKQLFGEEAMNSMGMLISNTEFLQQNFKLVGDASKYSGSVIAEYNNKLDTTATDLKLAMKATADMAAATTRFFLPPIRSAAGMMGEFSSGISEFTEKYPEVSKVLSYGAAGFIGLKLSTSGAVMGLKMLGNTKKDLIFLKDTAMLIKGWKQWGPILGGLKTGITTLGAVGKTALFNPWVLGIGAVVAGGYLAYKNWDKIKEGFKATGAYLKQGIPLVKEAFLHMVPGYAIYKNWHLIKKGFKNIYDYISGGILKLSDLWKKFNVPGRAFKWAKEKYKKYTGEGVPAYGRGGVVTSPHLAIVGDSKESIIPHDGSRRSRSLWYDAGNRMGMFVGKGIPDLASKIQETKVDQKINNKIDVHIAISPIIDRYKIFSLKEIEKETATLGKLIGDEIEKKLEEIERSKRRLSFE